MINSVIRTTQLIEPGSQIEIVECKAPTGLSTKEAPKTPLMAPA